MQWTLKNTTQVAFPNRYGHWFSQHFAKEDGSNAVRIDEMGINNVKSKSVVKPEQSE